MNDQPDVVADEGEAVKIRVEIEMIPIGQIHPNDLNPFDMQTDTFNELAEDMRRNGFKDPIDVRARAEGGVEIIDGEKRWRCGSLLGMTQLPCIRHDITDDDWRAIQTVRWNNIRGTVNPQMFLAMWTKLREKYEPEKLKRLLVIEDKSAVAKLVANASRNLPPALAKEMKKSAKETTTIKDLSSILHRLFADYGSDLKHSFMSLSGADECTPWSR